MLLVVKGLNCVKKTKNPEFKNGFAVGFFVAVIFATIVYGIMFYSYSNRVVMEVYTCALYETTPAAAHLAGWSCFKGNNSNPCYVADRVEYRGFGYTDEASIERANDRDYNLRLRGYNNSSILFKSLEFLNKTNEMAEQAINPFD